MTDLPQKICDPDTCENVLIRANGRRAHRESLGGNHIRFSRNQKYRVPEGVTRYLCGFPDPHVISKVVKYLKATRFSSLPELRFPDDDEEQLELVAKYVVGSEHESQFVRSIVLAENSVEGPQVEHLRDEIMQEYRNSVFSLEPRGPPPVRGPFGEATIELLPGTVPVKQRMYQIHGPRREAWVELIDRFVKNGWLEEGVSSWGSPSFPVPKKKPGTFKLLVNYRALNAVTIPDAHPLPRIEDILQRQGKFRV